MNDAVHSPNETRSNRWLLIAVAALVVGGLGVTFAAGAVLADGQSGSPAADSNASIELTYGGEAFVHESEFVYAWRRKALDVTVGVSGAESTSRACVYRGPNQTSMRRLGCFGLDGSNETATRTFANAGYGSDGPDVYRFAVRVADADNETVASTLSAPVVQITNWSSMNESELDEYAEDSGLVTTDSGGGGSTETASDSRTDTSASATPAVNGSKRAHVEQNVSNPGNVGGDVGVPGYVSLPDALSSGPVLLIAGGGLMALAALLYVQRRRGSTTAGAASANSIHPGGQTGRPVSDTEVVIRLLRENGGQLKQSDIVAATDWSKAKVSRLLSRMADHGRIRKEQDGRQNIIILRHQE